MEGIEPVLVAQEEVRERHHREELETDGGERQHHGAHRADLAEAGERHLDRDRGAGVVERQVAEHRFALPLPTRWLGQPEGEDRDHHDRRTEEDERPAPPAVGGAAEGHCDRAHQQRADDADEPA